MNSMGNLELVRYKFSKPENGEAAVCINMRKIKDTDIQTAGDEVTIYLPEPKFCYENQKQDRVQNPDGVIKQQAEQSGIFKVAKENAEKLVRSVVSSVTQKQIIINYIK